MAKKQKRNEYRFPLPLHPATTAVDPLTPRSVVCTKCGGLIPDANGVLTVVNAGVTGWSPKFRICLCVPRIIAGVRA